MTFTKCATCGSIAHPTHHCLVGQRIRLTHMGSDPDPIPAGTMGTVTFVDSIGTTFVAWDNGRRLGLLPDTDTYVIVGGLHPDGIPD